jgi:hypothetical protein
MARASGEDPFNITLSGGIGGAGNIGSIRRQASGNRSSVDSAGALGRSPSFGKNGMAKQPSFGRAATGTAPSSPYATNGGTILAGEFQGACFGIVSGNAMHLLHLINVYLQAAQLRAPLPAAGQGRMALAKRQGWVGLTRACSLATVRQR